MDMQDITVTISYLLNFEMEDNYLCLSKSSGPADPVSIITKEISENAIRLLIFKLVSSLYLGLSNFFIEIRYLDIETVF